ncbi:NADH-quinone oxidoreductase subunit NuoI [Armatimonas sp.]|jgi:NADH-quinone oxidoreductase subunit I|uniref:NADH-quinone oxidoreductase subunit NuoI n=1 Tax=Armatimonas sp. TaxID=1872638 RepID=UPI00286B027E|nr:NADH-quinone oxidoreductase subunit NuoI [Armatimonas sp.]
MSDFWADVKQMATEVAAPFKGLVTVGSKLTEKKTTIAYPEFRRPMGVRARWRHVLNRYDNGMEKCIGCSLCAGACPANAILVVAAENKDDARYSPGERYASRYEINMLRCIYCGFCQESCPTGAIELKDIYELAEDSRKKLVYTKEMLLVPDPNRERVD